ncbi:protein kinase [Thermodesulfobacteriota bacterium]
MGSSEKKRMWGDYEIHLDELIGAGGMGEVYKGRQISLDRTVAIKILKPQLTADQEFLTRFKHEASILAKIIDEHILQVYGAGEGDGKFFYAMEYVQGETLEQKIREQKALDEAEIIHIAIHIAMALASAWENKIVHRDLKPSNIIIQPNKKVKVMDFGIAKEKGSDLTQTGVILGTLKYMSPEQINADPVDVRSDIYALGVVMYEMATGVPPFESDRATRLLWMQMTQDPEPPEFVNPEISQALQAVILRCLTKRPKQRYQTPEELLKDLEGMEEKAAISRKTQDMAQTVLRGSAPIVGDIQKGYRRQNLKKAASWLILMIAGGIIAVLGIKIFFFDQPFQNPAQVKPAPDASRGDPYTNLLIEASRALDNKEYHTALTALKKAREIQDTMEVREEIKRATYRVKISLANQEEEKERWPEAATLYAGAMQYAEEGDKGWLKGLKEYCEELGKARDYMESGKKKEALPILVKLRTHQRHPDLIEQFIKQCKSSVTQTVRKLYNSAEREMEKGDWGKAYNTMSGLKKNYPAYLPSNFQTSWNIVVQAEATPEGMAYVPGGDFEMGTNSGEQYEGPAYTKSTGPYYIDRGEVSRGDYAKFLAYIISTGDHSMCHTTEPKERNGSPKDHTPYKWDSQQLDAEAVFGVDFWDACAYCARQNKRLPTEAEWEKAASWDWGKREKREYPYGPIWNRDDGPSPYGVLAMAGGVYEWTLDVPMCYGGSDAKKFGMGNSDYRIVRGGSKSKCTEDELKSCTKTTAREWYHTKYRQIWTGFRCVKGVK